MKRLAYLRPRCFDFLPQRSRRRPAARATKINTESLEVRSLLAGNVLASIQAGGLTLQGDNLDNDVRIDFDATTFSISGLNGTTINGDASFSRPISEISGVNRIGISLGNGNDSLGVFGTLPERGFVGTTTVDSGAGNDVLFMDGDINLGGDLNIRTQAGDDVVVLRGSTVADANIHTGAGNDRVGLLDVTVVDDLFIDASAGADIVGVAGLAVGDKTRVVLGSGDDTLLSDGSFTDENGVAAGSNRFFDRVDVLGGAGNDSFVVTGEHQAVQEIVVHGQSGRDAGLLAGVSGNISKVKVRSVRDTVSASVAEGLADQVRDQLTELTAFFGETTVTPPPVVDPGTTSFNEAALGADAFGNGVFNPLAAGTLSATRGSLTIDGQLNATASDSVDGILFSLDAAATIDLTGLPTGTGGQPNSNVSYRLVRVSDVLEAGGMTIAMTDFTPIESDNTGAGFSAELSAGTYLILAESNITTGVENYRLELGVEGSMPEQPDTIQIEELNGRRDQTGNDLSGTNSAIIYGDTNINGFVGIVGNTFVDTIDQYFIPPESISGSGNITASATNNNVTVELVDRASGRVLNSGSSSARIAKSEIGDQGLFVRLTSSFNIPGNIGNMFQSYSLSVSGLV